MNKPSLDQVSPSRPTPARWAARRNGPSSVAAINAGGVTLHSFFQMPFGPDKATTTSP